MEPGLIAMVVLMSLGGLIALGAIVTHVWEWRILAAQKAKKAQEDVEKAKMRETYMSNLKSPMHSSPSGSNQSQHAKKAAFSSKPVTSPGFVSLASPAVTMNIQSPTMSLDGILHITSPSSLSAPSPIYSPTSPNSVPSPITPYTPYTPDSVPSSAIHTEKSQAKLSIGEARPLLPSPPYSKIAIRPTEHNDNYTQLSPQVLNSRVRRYATPPRYLTVTIPPRNLTALRNSGRNQHRRLPSEPKITAPPRVLARSVSELVGWHDDGETESMQAFDLGKTRTERDVNNTEQNINEVARFGW